MRAGWLGACFLGATAASRPTPAATVDFESALYVHDKTLVEVDGWTRSSQQSGQLENFRTFAENGALGGNKWMRIRTEGQSTLFREFPPIQLGALDVQWRWRLFDIRADACLGVSSVNDNVLAATRASVCFHPQGKVAVTELLSTRETPANATWAAGTIYFLRMRLDRAANAYSVYLAADSLRGDERLIAGPVAMAGLATAGFNRLVVRTDNGIGNADLDDIAWEAVAHWKGNWDILASNPKNWSTGVTPDSSTHVVLDAASERNLFLDKPVAIKSIAVEKGFAMRLDLASNILTVSGKADFTGLKDFASTTGVVRMNSARAQTLVGPDGYSGPTILHDGTGLLRLDGRAWYGRGFGQTAGSLDFNKFDMSLSGYLSVQNGGPASLHNLGGRTLSVAKSARLEGSAGSLLSLKAASPWNITVLDTLVARFAEIQGSNAGGAVGYAVQSVDKGGNAKWVFAAAPTITANPLPVSVMVGQKASLKVSANGSGLPLTYQWSRNGVALPGEADSILTRAQAALADNGSYLCQVSTALGIAVSLPAAIAVSFPPPTAQPANTNFPDTLTVKVTSSVAGASLHASANGQPFAPFAGALLLRETTTLKAFAVFGKDSSDTALWKWTRSSLPKVAEPNIVPEVLSFTDSLVVTMEPVTPGSVIHYTLDQTTPTTASPVYRNAIVLKATTVVSAFAAMPGMEASSVYTHVYTLLKGTKIDPPTASPPGGAFGESLTVTLRPPATAPSAVVWYRVNGGPMDVYARPLVLKETATVKAFALLTGSSSDTATWIFTRRLEAPVATPKGRIFADTLRIALVPKIQDAAVHFTLDGRTPDASSPRYERPFLLDSTAVLKAVTVKPGMATSEVLIESYDLVPDSLKASPRGGDFSAGIFIQLETSATKTVVWYTTDGSDPGPGLPGSLPYAGGIRLDRNATLKAMAIAGQGPTLRKGRTITEVYTFITAAVHQVGGGQTVNISPRYSLSNPYPGAPVVQMEVLTLDSLKGVVGFRDVQFGIRVSLPPGSPGFPDVILAAPLGEERALYDLGPGGVMQFISSDDTVRLPGTGTYFLGVDTVPPRITLSGETMVGEAARLVFSVQDNVSSLTLDIERSDDPTLNATGKALSNPDLVTLTLQSQSLWSPLWVKLRVGDRRNESRFPADRDAAYPVSRKAGTAVRSPSVFRVGGSPDLPWDMVSIPLDIEGALTFGKLKSFNSVKGLEAKLFDPVQGKSRPIADNEALPAGQAFWLGSPTSLSSLTLPPFQTATRKGQEAYRIKLKKGWNQVANPGLQSLIWPSSRQGLGYINGLIKGLHAYDPSLPGYRPADTLHPWKGYYAYYKGTQDTLVTLRASPVPPAPAKRGAPAGDRLVLSLGLDRLPLLVLGAVPMAVDGLGVEDEPQPQVPSGRGPALWSERGGARLGTDWVRWSPAAIHSWRVVASGNARDTLASGRSARIEGVELPAGWAAFAVSRTRGLRYALTAGAGIPLRAGAADSLEVHAGPEALLAARLAGIPSAVSGFRLEALATRGGWRLQAALPEAARLRFTLVSLDGRVLDAGALDLAPGHYDLHRSGRAGSLPPGLAVLRAEWTSSGRSGSLARKLTVQ